VQALRQQNSRLSLALNAASLALWVSAVAVLVVNEASYSESARERRVGC